MIEVNIALSDMLLINEAMKKADSNEIGGFGTIVYSENGVPYVEHLYIPRQTISGTEVDWGMDGVLDYVAYLRKMGDTRESRGIFSWHSHNNMPPFWSATDEKFIRLAGEEGVPYVFSVVLNNKGERLERLDVFPKNNCRMIDRPSIHIAYDETEVDLNVYETEKITRRRLEVDKIRDAMEADIESIKAQSESQIKEIEKKYEDDIKAASKHVSNMTNSLRGDAKKHIEDIWDERITEEFEYNWTYSGVGRTGLGYSPSWRSDDIPALEAGEWEEIDDVVAELGEDIMYFEYDKLKDKFISNVDIPGINRNEISINEAKFNRLDVYDTIDYRIENVTVFEYLMSNYDIDDRDGRYEYVADDYSSWFKESEAANEASLM